jgi:hypothetical protein
LLSVKDQQEGDDDEDNEVWKSLCAEPHFESFMPFERLKELRRFFHKNLRTMIRRTQIHGSNSHQLLMSSMISGKMKLMAHFGEESMCAWRPCENSNREAF